MDDIGVVGLGSVEADIGAGCSDKGKGRTGGRGTVSC